jgi:hypothetical protein
VAGLGGAPRLGTTPAIDQRPRWVAIDARPARMEEHWPHWPKIILGVDVSLAIRWPNSEVPIFVQHNGTYAVELPGVRVALRTIFSLPPDFLARHNCEHLRIVTKADNLDQVKAQFSLVDKTYYIV